ncbi:hypothetical protein BY458DRAFT_487038 [Sporodiniella umbellata]|nr:hypothetical protein BY458DRAFT_487038 [Sporodiniella umbellata]
MPEKGNNRYNLTAAQVQQKELDRLFQKIDKPIPMPTVSQDGSPIVAPPKDFVRNVSGSSAGAGSGDFHVYRAQRRREYARMKTMEDQEKQEKIHDEYQLKLARLREQDEERTAKKRAKRQKRNNNKKKKVETQEPK